MAAAAAHAHAPPASTGGAAVVLMVAEKPSLATAIAGFLSRGAARARRGAGAADVYEWEGAFLGRRAAFRMTSVCGHLLSIDFPPAYNSWDRRGGKGGMHLCRHLQAEARGCSHLVLWLDCDREGENICFEVMDNTAAWMRPAPPGQQARLFSFLWLLAFFPIFWLSTYFISFSLSTVWRARFSAVSAAEVEAAMGNLVSPNKNESDAVDARQELDLRVGVAFTRFQTRFFQGRYGNLDASVVSYGPCQTPTLNFCVERHQAIVAFQPEPYWVVAPAVAKGGDRLPLDWGRGRVFDADVAALLHANVRAARTARVVSVSAKEERRPRPHGLNTVELLKAASSSLGLGPAHAMQIAERLYTSGYLSYPRTESTAYPPNFDMGGALGEQARHPVWGEYASAVLAAGAALPKGGHDAGDHPPITPVAPATEAELGGGDAWRVYDFVARWFLGSLSPDCVVRRTKAVLTAGGEAFTATGTVLLRPGFTAIMPWRAPQSEPLPPLSEGEALPLQGVELVQGRTAPPDQLTEAELIERMERHGIGTDASIPTHINNIIERGYARVEAGRRVAPTELGVTLIRGYQLIDPELCQPQVRAHVEAQLSLVAQGLARREAVVAHTLGQFRSKFAFFVTHIVRMDSLFEASFSPLSSSGRPISKCGKCRRYLKYIGARPQRLYCPTCEDVYPLPQGGTIKQYKGDVCPLDGFELLLFSLAGADGKHYPLCPLCYSAPPFEPAAPAGGEGGGGGSLRAGMPCTTCLHPTCKHAPSRQGVMPCAECGVGTLVLDPVSGPNRCSFLVYLPKDVHEAKVARDGACEECGSRLVSLDFKKGAAPAGLPLAGGTAYSGCVACDDALSALCEASGGFFVDVKHGKAWAKRGGGRRGRGRGRGRRGRGRGRANVDPRMTFDGF
ncbi:DNA topoisomerase [Raphidocelis subcapitata]|uniref:DNA topoisomerase n=1 Tax=Raphidocelis subcapitata TaxID=307507 RepID=A0A2V0P1C4_9CHLO|nr:DNA topoisomerase [Raphidocelis subcapitata]|eukprot:GBF93668.1 DNA topoisomerase [Raphidocelis subcapitata]